MNLGFFITEAEPKAGTGHIRCRRFLSFFQRYVSVKSKLKHPPPGNPPGIWIFGKFLFKFSPPEAEKLFKCPIIGPFPVIKCPHPGKRFSGFYYASKAVYVNMV